MGLTPDYAIGVSIGYDEPLTLGGKEAGGVTAVPVFVNLVAAMHLPAKKFAPPGGVVEVAIDKVTGLRAAEGAPGRDSQLREVFVKGTEPTEIAPLPARPPRTPSSPTVRRGAVRRRRQWPGQSPVTGRALATVVALASATAHAGEAPREAPSLAGI